MKRLAVFVEGATDQAFMERLIDAIAGHGQVTIELTDSFRYGATMSLTRSIYSAQQDNRRFHVWIVNCGTDERVVTVINERYDYLVSAGYDIVIGMRDVFPEGTDKVDQMRIAVERSLTQGTLRVEIVLAVMELEAWFLGEVTHFVRIDNRLTTQFIERNLGLDLTTIDIEAVAHPTKDIGQIYRLVGRRYQKGRFRALQTLDRIDYEEIYLTVANRAPALRELCQHLESVVT